MALGKWIQVQFTHEDHALIKAKAEKKGMPLGEHVRQVLMKYGAEKPAKEAEK